MSIGCLCWIVLSLNSIKKQNLSVLAFLPRTVARGQLSDSVSINSISQTSKKTIKNHILLKALIVKIYQGGLSAEEIGRGAQDFCCKKGEVVFTDGYAVCMDE